MVTNKTVLLKMKKEIEEAIRKQTNQNEMTKHIASVKLLCELLLEEDSSPVVSGQDMTEAEIKTMIGAENASSVSKKHTNASAIDHDDANGKSIFDF
ncbi:DUF5327 family protein [Virgibacillus oceani]|uniref:YwdI family protein n=1 Tax=Virgibacillus oceani TaxID=1479511 RepID=A0A917H7Z0_9BACI|nr:DUF5327 family protein [Virgibacillus oceani]GGG70941.1 hypothetical protein GCM10011398_13860 [Virgibacillus oceani]